MTVDLSPVINAGILAVAAGVSIYAVPLIRQLSRKAGVELSAAQQQLLQSAIDKSIEAAAVGAEGLAAQKGWDHPDVKSEVASRALGYAIGKFPEVLQQCGIGDLSASDGGLAALRGAIAARLPAAMTPVAASPVTTSGPPPAAAAAAAPAPQPAA